jgi:nicotinamidase-related amidase
VDEYMGKEELARHLFANREDSLLVVIDMQERLVPAMAHAERIIDNTKRLLALSRIMNLPVVFTEQEKLGPTVDELTKDVKDHQPVTKLAFNCFSSVPFFARLRETGRHTLIIAGIEAHICVAQTALWAHPRYNVHVVSDAISSRSPDNYSIAIERMRTGGLTITSTEMVIYELLQKAGTDEFRAMLPLIK